MPSSATPITLEHPVQAKSTMASVEGNVAGSETPESLLVFC